MCNAPELNETGCRLLRVCCDHSSILQLLSAEKCEVTGPGDCPSPILSWYENRPDTFSGKSPRVRLQEIHKNPTKDEGENNNSFL